MYLSFGFHGAARGMDLKTRAAKVAEIWKQLNWLEGYAEPGDSYLCGAELTLADFTWFPTAVFMEYMLPRVFGWPQIFAPPVDENPHIFPKMAAWFGKCKAVPAFAEVHREIWAFWEGKEAEGQFQHISEELASPEAEGLKFKFP